MTSDELILDPAIAQRLADIQRQTPTIRATRSSDSGPSRGATYHVQRDGKTLYRGTDAAKAEKAYGAPIPDAVRREAEQLHAAAR